MNKFIHKILIFCVAFIPFGLEVFLPLNTFTFRPDEALLYAHSGLGFPFYPNHEIEMQSQGDLAAFSKYSIAKDLFWITDSLGYRNNKFIHDPDIVIIGDSFVLGSSLTQDSTITNLLFSKFHHKLKIYNLAFASITEFKVLLDNSIIQKPKLLIFEMGERDMSSEAELNTKGELYKNTKFKLWINKATRFYSFNYIASRFFNKRIKGIQSEINENMFFIAGRNQEYHWDKIRLVIEKIEAVKHFCNKQNIKLLFLPCPNKETIYYEQIPFKEQPDYLFYLDDELKKRNIITINTLEKFNQARQQSNNLIYHLDDTHWNSNGVNIIADEIVKEIKNNPDLDLNDLLKN